MDRNRRGKREMNARNKRNTKWMTTSVPLSWKKMETLITTQNLNLSNAFSIIILFDVHNNSVNSYKSWLSENLKDQP